MKTRNKISLLTGVAALSLVGLGYAAWTFSADVAATTSSNVYVTAKNAEVGTLTVDAGQTFVLVLDQDGIAWQTESTNDLDSTKAVSEVKLTYSGSKAEDYDGGYAVNETVTVNMAAKYGALTTYVDFGAVEADKTVNYVGEDITYAFTLPTVSYVESAYPRNEKAYDAMVTALKDAKVELTFTASVNECTH